MVGGQAEAFIFMHLFDDEYIHHKCIAMLTCILLHIKQFHGKICYKVVLGVLLLAAENRVENKHSSVCHIDTSLKAAIFGYNNYCNFSKLTFCEKIFFQCHKVKIHR